VKLVLLTSTLVGEVLLFVLLWIATEVVLLGLVWATGLLRWNSSRLPAQDPSYDLACDGWWFDDPDPDDPQYDLVYRKGPQNQLQVLLTHERVVQKYLTVWHAIDGAQL
jgi:hypothetical protein